MLTTILNRRLGQQLGPFCHPDDVGPGIAGPEGGGAGGCDRRRG